MILFHGGLTEVQAELIRRGKYKIYPKLPVRKIKIPNEKNTFPYCDSDIICSSEKQLKREMRDDMYEKQYIYFFKYLESALEFCGYEKKYILVADVSSLVLDEFVGVGVYGHQTPKYRIEYRIPGNIIVPSAVKKLIPYNSTLALDLIRLKYGDSCIRNPLENEEALEVIHQKKLVLQKPGDYLK